MIHKFIKDNFLIGAGVFLILIWSVISIAKISPASFSSTPFVYAQEYAPLTMPDRISIPEINTNVMLKASYIADGKWQTVDEGASYLASSSRPGYGKNIIIYGHNKNSIFKNLSTISTGDEIILYNKLKEKFTYVVREYEIVKPSDIKYLNKKISNETLTIYTCTGFADLKRLVIKATPIN